MTRSSQRLKRCYDDMLSKKDTDNSKIKNSKEAHVVQQTSVRGVPQQEATSPFAAKETTAQKTASATSFKNLVHDLIGTTEKVHDTTGELSIPSPDKSARSVKTSSTTAVATAPNPIVPKDKIEVFDGIKVIRLPIKSTTKSKKSPSNTHQLSLMLDDSVGFSAIKSPPTSTDVSGRTGQFMRETSTATRNSIGDAVAPCTTTVSVVTDEEYPKPPQPVVPSPVPTRIADARVTITRASAQQQVETEKSSPPVPNVSRDKETQQSDEAEVANETVPTNVFVPKPLIVSDAYFKKRPSKFSWDNPKPLAKTNAETRFLPDGPISPHQKVNAASMVSGYDHHQEPNQKQTKTLVRDVAGRDWSPREQDPCSPIVVARAAHLDLDSAESSVLIAQRQGRISSNICIGSNLLNDRKPAASPHHYAHRGQQQSQRVLPHAQYDDEQYDSDQQQDPAANQGIKIAKNSQMIDLSHDDEKPDEVFSVNMDVHAPQQQDVLQNLRDQVVAEEAQLEQLKNIVRLRDCCGKEATQRAARTTGPGCFIAMLMMNEHNITILYRSYCSVNLHYK